MEYIAKPSYEKTVDRTMALIANAVFRMYKIMANKVTFIGFGESIAPPPPGSSLVTTGQRSTSAACQEHHHVSNIN